MTHITMCNYNIDTSSIVNHTSKCLVKEGFCQINGHHHLWYVSYEWRFLIFYTISPSGTQNKMARLSLDNGFSFPQRLFSSWYGVGFWPMAALQRKRLSHTVVLVCFRFFSTVAYSFVIALAASMQFDVLTEKHSLCSY